MCCSGSRWIEKVWQREIKKEHISVVKEVTKAFENIGKEIEIRVDGMKIDGIELGRNYKENNKLLKKGEKEKKHVVKKMQSEIWSMQKGDSFEWLKCGMKPEKTSSIFQMSEQM